jgi:signal transduction histidine kinase
VIPHLRVRLTAIYGGIFVVFVAILLSISYWLMARHLGRTLEPFQAATALEQLRMQYLLALAGASLVATALGWALAGRELSSMQAAFDARERFVANASHELRSPLTVIRTEADVTLADPDATVDELRAMGHEVLGAADEMDALLDGLMVLARSGRELPNREYVDLAAAAGAAARRVRAGGVRVRLELSPAAVSGERRLLERLAGNLIENGVRYNAPGGFVAVRTSAVGGGAVLDVVNSGPVIDPAMAARLVEPFERGGRTGRGGAGLGLSIVRSVAEAHGGRLALTPRAEGGLAVRVTLPGA